MTMRNGAGDRDDTFHSMYRRYYPRMLRFFQSAFRLSLEDAEDLTQDAFGRFYKTIDEYRGDAQWALLEKIARNVAFNRIRAQTTLKRGVKTTSLDDPAASAHHPVALHTDTVERLIEAEQSTRLRKALSELPKGQRQSLQLWLDGFKYEEIANVLHMSVDAVKSRIRDAKRQLHDKLGDEDALPEDQS
jgi:RNA polymerase sigma-70 factor (ECF subfamily)